MFRESRWPHCGWSAASEMAAVQVKTNPAHRQRVT